MVWGPISCLFASCQGMQYILRYIHRHTHLAVHVQGLRSCRYRLVPWRLHFWFWKWASRHVELQRRWWYYIYSGPSITFYTELILNNTHQKGTFSEYIKWLKLKIYLLSICARIRFQWCLCSWAFLTPFHSDSFTMRPVTIAWPFMAIHVVGSNTCTWIAYYSVQFFPVLSIYLKIIAGCKSFRI